jgi:spore germination protein
MQDIAKPEIVWELEKRIKKVRIDAIINAGELEELIEDHPYSIFPQFETSERPDHTSMQLLQGRIAVLVDHSPRVIIAPMNFTSYFQSVDDFSFRWAIASFTRFLRLSAIFIATVFPATYIAIISFHYEVIPMDLMLSIASSRARVPFPPIIEALLMELAIEMLREAGLRLPKSIGQTIGVVGGIVIGEAAVQAGIVSNIMVIVVAVTAISSYIIPNFDMASSIRLSRFPIMILASILGMVGIIIGVTIIIIHLTSMESLGVPYTSPLAPMRFSDWKDTWIRIPLRKMINRPLSVHPTQLKRQGHKKE